MLLTYTFCPNCDEFFAVTSHDEFRLGKAQECPRCKNRFNIFQVYRTIFEEIPMGKTVADKAVDFIQSTYRIEGENKEEVQKIKKFMTKNFSPEKLKKIIYDCVVYGTCFLRKNMSENGEILLTDIYLPDYEIIQEFRQRPGYQAYAYYIKELKNIKTGDTITHEEIVSLYTESAHRGDEVGFSRFGMWFNKWHVLKIGPEATINASIIGAYTEGNTMKVFFDKTKQDMFATVFPMSIGEGDHERGNLSSRITNQTFPSVLGREWSMDNQYPQIVFDKDNN